MSQPRGLTIRPGMDVYSADQSEYIGSVVKVWHGEKGNSSDGGKAEQTGSVSPAMPDLVHEQGATQSPTEYAGPRMLGEEMGPFPTISAGNTGPVTQSAEHGYATAAIHGEPDVIAFAVRPGRINLGPLTPCLHIPVSAVRSVSMERVVLDVQKEHIPAPWRGGPPKGCL
jgi:hypothetical protein